MITNRENRKPNKKPTRKARVMFDSVVDIDIRQVENARLVVSTEDASNRVRDIPTESWSKVEVFTSDFIQLLECDVTSVSGQDACRLSNGVMSSGSPCCMDQRGKAPEWTLP